MISQTWRYFHLDASGYNWNISDQCSAYGNGTYSMKFDNYWVDAHGGRDEVWLQKTDLDPIQQIALHFDVAYAQYGGQYSDTLAVLVSQDCGDTWNLLYRKGGDELAGIKEVAEEAGVSTATVSRALRGLHHVNQQTREKIIAAAEKLNYPLNTERQGASSGRTNSVGIVAPYISRWYFSQVISGAEQALREAGMDLLLYNFSQMKGRERLFQHQLLKGRVDALIVISLPPTEEEFDSMLS